MTLQAGSYFVCFQSASAIMSGFVSTDGPLESDEFILQVKTKMEIPAESVMTCINRLDSHDPAPNSQQAE